MAGYSVWACPHCHHAWTVMRPRAGFYEVPRCPTCNSELIRQTVDSHLRPIAIARVTPGGK
jgi:NAD-dependent SIR2 family protein deacetylase